MTGTERPPTLSPGPPSGSPAVAEAGAGASQALEPWVSRLEEAANLTRLLGILDELEAGLRQHYAAEEGPDGLAADVTEHAIHQLGPLQRLMAEHPQLLAELAGVRERAECCRRELKRLATDLREHESRVSAFLMDAALVDVGVGD